MLLDCTITRTHILMIRLINTIITLLHWLVINKIVLITYSQYNVSEWLKDQNERNCFKPSSLYRPALVFFITFNHLNDNSIYFLTRFGEAPAQSSSTCSTCSPATFHQLFHQTCLTCKRHEDVTVLRRHRFHPRLMRHDVSPRLQQPLSEQLI